LGNCNTQGERRNEHDLSDDLPDSMKPDQAREAEETNGDGTEWEEDGKGQTGKNTMGNELYLL
jgi:hypothetical protein